MQKVVILLVALLASVSCAVKFRSELVLCQSNCQNKVISDKGNMSVSQAKKYGQDQVHILSCIQTTPECKDFYFDTVYYDPRDFATCMNKCGDDLSSNYAIDQIKCECETCAQADCGASNIVLSVLSLVLIALFAF